MDRSSTLRKLIVLGYKEHMKKKAAEDYRGGRITLTQAASIAELTVWDMEHYLVEHGFKTGYSLDDLRTETAMLLAEK
ncbi:UPF0175 family protein [Candidatus Woesearchaeota archaeon]|nr:UPF0175 family protein [Candidatus Woesearchaeota archaeon]